MSWGEKLYSIPPEELSSLFKQNGHFDHLRKLLFQDFQAENEEFVKKIKKTCQNYTERHRNATFMDKQVLRTKLLEEIENQFVTFDLVKNELEKKIKFDDKYRTYLEDNLEKILPEAEGKSFDFDLKELYQKKESQNNDNKEQQKES